MAIRDLSDEVDTVQSLAPAPRTATANGNGVDLRGYDSAMIVVSFGTWTDGTHTPSVQHSVDGTTYTTVSASDLLGSFTAISGSAGSNTIQRVSYIGDRRYVRTVVTVSGATTGAISSSTVLRGHPHRRPLA